ncbi:FecR family protein [Spirosoma aerolatum]|uniref:FecR family protein n=1 Tax=Spirosoma aerolatum TaxID=1211326 RepID=UPI0009AD9B9F|nr:FecR domain-containing protein [Spirosoma aerolatum]
MKSTITKELIVDYLSGNASALQKQLIDEWVLAEENEELFYKWLEEYELAHPEYNANVEGAIANYHRFAEKIDSSEVVQPALVTPKTVHLVRGDSNWFRLSIAASVLLVLLTVGYLKKDAWYYQTYSTDFGETKSVTLPDGSQVTLNANSSLRLPRWGFAKNTRHVFLLGEASFSVKHTATHQPFVVQTDRKFDVVVLGTEFSVFARERKAKIVLSKGKVQLNVQVGPVVQKMIMKPGDLITLDSQNHAQLTTTSQPEMHSAWRGHRYVFDGTTLQEIIYLLAENYGITAQVADKSLLSLTLSGSFTADNADQLVEVVDGVLGLQSTRQDNHMMISQGKP